MILTFVCTEIALNELSGDQILFGMFGGRFTNKVVLSDRASCNWWLIQINGRQSWIQLQLQRVSIICLCLCVCHVVLKTQLRTKE